MRRSTRNDLAPQHADEFGGWFWENVRIHTPFKTLALVAASSMLVVGCGREGATARTFNTLSYDATATPASSKKPRTLTPEEQFAAAAAGLKPLLAKRSHKPLTATERRAFVRGERQLERTHAAVIRRFTADHTKLAKLDATDALQRLETIQRATAQKQAAWDDAVGKLAQHEDDRQAAKAAEDALAALVPDPTPQATSSTGAFGTPDAVAAAPILSAGITPAYSAPIGTAQASGLPRTPEGADLASTPDTVVTPAITALAQQLDRDPVKIYTYVRNTIAYEPYFGIRKGADVTLKEKAGSDADQAALTIALLRASGVPARFVRGTVELPADVAANWLGVNTAAGEQASAAADILSSGGIPTTAVKVNGQLTTVRFDHIWAEANVAADAYRGVDEQVGSKRWLPLDPSVKPNVLKAPTIDLTSLLQPAAKQWIRDYADKVTGASNGTAVLPTPAEATDATKALMTSARSVVAAHGGIDEFSDLIGSSEIRKTQAAYLPSSAPFRTKTVAGEWRTVPSSLSAEVSISVAGASTLSMPAASEETDGTLQFTGKTHDLAEKRISLTYVPASVADADVIDAYHGMLNTPAYGAQLTPVLWVDGHEVARGSTPVPVGYQQRFTIKYRSPGFASDTVDNPVVVGSLSTLTLAVGATSASALHSRAEVRLQGRSTTTRDNLLTDGRVGEYLSELGGYYFLRNDAFNAVASQSMGVSAVRALSGAIVSTQLGITYVAGFPVRAAMAGLSIDVDEDVQAVVAKRAGADLTDRYIRKAAAYASSSEGEIFNRAFHAFGFKSGVSTVSVLKAAAEQRIPLVSITSANVSQIDSLLNVSPGVKADIRQAITDGATRVLIPQRTVQLGHWTGSGYIGDYGHAYDYRISGGLSGGVVGGPLLIEGFSIEFYEALFAAVRPDDLGVESEEITDIFDAYIDDKAAFVKDSRDCFQEFVDSAESQWFITNVMGALIGMELAAEAGNLAGEIEGTQIEIAFKAGEIGLLIESAAVYGQMAAIAVLECGA